MGTDQRDDIAVLLEHVRDGRADAFDRLVRAIYGELVRVARGLMRRERPDHTLQPSALVHEALLRLLSGDTLTDVPNRHYLFAAAARAMRQVLVEHARRRRAQKREGCRARIPLDQALVGFEERGLDVIALEDALEGLARAHPRQAQVVDLRFFGGLSVTEIAAVLGVSDTTVEGDWRFARAWLKGQLGGSEP
jgi:RNA polymerase sigma-70 factor (ECF subfamily)